MSSGYDGARILQRPVTIPEALRAAAERQGEAIAWRIDGPTGLRTLSWSDLARLSHEVAAGLTRWDVRLGDVVAVMTEPGADAQIAELGVQCAAAVALSIPTDTSDDVLAKVWADHAPRVALADAPSAARLRSLATGSDTRVVELGSPEWHSLTLAGAGALTEDAELVAGRSATLDAASPAVIVLAEDGSTRVLHHGSQTYQGSALVALGHLGPDDVVLFAPAPTMLTRTVLAAHLDSGCAAVTVSADSLAAGPALDALAVAVKATALVIDAALLDDAAASLAEEPGLRVCLTEGPVDTRPARLIAGRDGFAVTLSSAVGGGVCAIAMDSDEPERIGEPLPYTALRVDDKGDLHVKGPAVAAIDVNADVAVSSLGPVWRSLGLEATEDNLGRIVRVIGTAIPQSTPAQPEAPAEEAAAETDIDDDADHGADDVAEHVAETPAPEDTVEVAEEPTVLDAELLPPDPSRAVAVPGSSEMERGFIRLCAPASRFVVIDGGATGPVALVGLGEESLRRWAETYLVGGDTFAELAAAAETHGYIAACVQAANVWAPGGQQITNFAILDHPVDDPSTTETELLSEHEQLVHQLIVTAA
ncbi:AMP-binding protein [Nocardioides sp. GXZ039]|uniref:AMP-binding protein n=1 Tax=Nocardioides sp. GXZ039 TaxID=3136018 RepID=UPI0030F39101